MAPRRKKKKGIQKNCGKGVGSQLKGAKASHSWMKQAFLMNFVHPLTDPINYAPLVADKLADDDSSKYIKRVSSPKKNSSLVNLLTTSPSVMTFLDGSPVDYAQLVPYIKLYKVYIKNKKEVAEVLMPFQANTDFSNFKELAREQGSLFRGRDAGIQDVEIKMEGRQRNPVSANVMHVTIKYFFNDVKTLFAPLALDPFSTKNINKNLRSYVTYSDLIRYPPSLKDGASAHSLDASFRIRLVLGWGVNQENKIFANNKAFVDAARTAKVNFIGDLFTHNLDFKEDGSVVVTAQYKGALETAFASTAADILNKANISKDADMADIKAQLNKVEATGWDSLKLTGRGASKKKKKINDLTKALNALEMYIEARKAFAAALKKKPIPDGVAKQFSKAVQSYKSAFVGQALGGGSAMTKLQNIAKGLKVDTYPTKEQIQHERKTLRAMRTSRSKDKALSRSDKRKIKKVVAKINKEKAALKGQIKALQNSIKAEKIFEYVMDLMDRNMIGYTYTDRKSSYAHYVRLRNYYENADSFDEKTATKKANELTAMLRKEKPRTAGGTPSEGDAAAKSKGKKGKKKGNSNSRHATQLLRTGRYRGGDKIFFFRLGDLLSTILDTGNFGAKIENLAPDFRILLGEYYYYNVNAADQPRVESTSLYNLPISLEIFNAFVSTTIVGSGRPTYPLMSFVWDLIKFVMDKTMVSFGKSAQGGLHPIVEPINFKLDMTAIDLVKDQITGDADVTVTDNATINTLQVSNEAGGYTKTPINQVSNAFLFHAQHSAFNKRIKVDRVADRAADAQDGVPHFYVGGPNRGVLKKITFQEVKNTLFSTALMRNGQEGGIDSGTGVIRPTKFNCEVTMVGNPYFYIGQLFYVNSELISGGMFREEQILNGGYYFITSVESRLNSNGWETRVQAVMNIPDSNLKFSQKHNPVRPLSTMSAAKIEEIAQIALTNSLSKAASGNNNGGSQVETTEQPKIDKKGKKQAQNTASNRQIASAGIPITANNMTTELSPEMIRTLQENPDIWSEQQYREMGLNKTQIMEVA